MWIPGRTAEEGWRMSRPRLCFGDRNWMRAALQQRRSSPLARAHDGLVRHAINSDGVERINGNGRYTVKKASGFLLLRPGLDAQTVQPHWRNARRRWVTFAKPQRRGSRPRLPRLLVRGENGGHDGTLFLGLRGKSRSRMEAGRWALSPAGRMFFRSMDAEGAAIC